MPSATYASCLEDKVAVEAFLVVADGNLAAAEVLGGDPAVVDEVE